MKKQLYNIVLLFVILIFLGSCDKKEEKEQPAPLIPPVGTLVIDFSQFENIDTNLVRNTESFENFGVALDRILPWQHIIYERIPIPIVGYAEAHHHNYFYDPNYDSWSWSYQFAYGGEYYHGKLQAWLDPAGVQWAFYVTRDDDYYEFLWMKGVAEANLTRGFWTIYLDPDNWEPYIEINYKIIEDGRYEITYENVLHKDVNEGSYISYTYDSTSYYNSHYEIYKVYLDNTTEIDWNSDSFEGRITDMLYYKNDLWYCWDESAKNIDCN